MSDRRYNTTRARYGIRFALYELFWRLRTANWLEWAEIFVAVALVWGFSYLFLCL